MACQALVIRTFSDKRGYKKYILGVGIRSFAFRWKGCMDRFKVWLKQVLAQSSGCVLPKSACPRIPSESVLIPTSSVGSQEAVLGEDNYGILSEMD
jgi:hypothetical protein